jgi:phosphate transport system substrate-binding protein
MTQAKKGMPPGAGIFYLGLALGVALCVLVYLSPRFFTYESATPKYPRLKTGGTSVVSVILQNRWKTAFRDGYGIDVDYESTGSTKGLTKLIDREYAIAFTHASLSAEQRQTAEAKGGKILQLPILLCGVAPIYNVKGLKGKAPLNFTGAVLAKIFLGQIGTWDHADLKELNPGTELPKTPIVVVHREDSSGTTHLFTEYLAAESPEWREKVGPAASEVKWPTGVGAERSLGVLERVFRTEGAIGYVDRLFTSYELMDVAYGAVQNKDRTAFVRAEPDNMTAAMQAAVGAMPADLGFELADRPGKESYPITGVIYALCYQAQPASSQKALTDFLNWVVHGGQSFAARTRFAALPSEVVERVDKEIQSIKPAS